MFSARRVATVVPLIGHPFYFQAAKINYFSEIGTDLIIDFPIYSISLPSDYNYTSI